MTESELKAIEKRANAATPAPWDWDDSRVFSRSEGFDGPTLVAAPQNATNTLANVAFITAARDDVPTLVAEVRRLRGLIAATGDRNGRLRNFGHDLCPWCHGSPPSEHVECPAFTDNGEVR